MSTFVLIHGGWHGAWCWNRVSPLLEEASHTVLAPDLPGHGQDHTPRPYERYVPRVIESLDQLQAPAILAGHSSGGMIISEVAAHRPQQVAALVYVAAFLLRPGKTPRDIMSRDTESKLASCLLIDGEKGVSIIKPECAKNVFYADCSPEDAAWACARLQPEPLIPPQPVTAPPQPPPPIRRFYIECTADQALGPKMQRWMYTESPCERVYSLSTSHSPFISAPQALVQCLLDIAGS